ncbi:MAG: hypothetical protein JWO69_2047 [Thermoleophilia bacterium]|nr:hypothetical protein [Thermoleophilia bacterium]
MSAPVAPDDVEAGTTAARSELQHLLGDLAWLAGGES